MAKTILDKSTASFAEMIKEFGAVTVMEAKIYDPNGYDFSTYTAENIATAFESAAGPILLAEIDSLKIANITVEGPSKTITGGQYSNPLIKFGKTARIEMQDALGRADALEAFGGVVNEYNDSDSIQAVHVTEDFVGPRTIIGKSFFIDRSTGKQVPVKILIYQVLPDSIFNLTQDPEGDASVFDMNGDVLTTVIKTYDKNKAEINHGVFYSIIADSDTSTTYYTTTTDADGNITYTAKTNYSLVVDGATAVPTATITPDTSSAVMITVIDTENSNNVVYRKVLQGYKATA